LYGNKVAVSDLTLEVARGEVFGFLGPNGAGKSTSIKMLLGLTFPSSGWARVLGRPLGDAYARRKIGFLPEHFRFYEWLSGTELLELHGHLCGMDFAKLRRSVAELLDLVGLSPHAGKKLRDYSKGMLQRVGLAQALLNDPEVIFLDEPTSGLDPLGRRLVRDIVREQRRRSVTVFLNSHLLSEVELTCDRVAFIKRGVVLEVRDIASLSRDTVVHARVAKLTPTALAALPHWATDIRHNGEQLSLRVNHEDLLPEIVRHLAASGVDVYSVTPQRMPLEELFVHIIGEDEGT
jgi:ABC-2 type transport system ATP-binding protein